MIVLVYLYTIHCNLGKQLFSICLFYRLLAVLKCLIILVIPLFLLEFLNSLLPVVLNSLLPAVLQKAVSKSLAKANIIWFLGKTDKRRTIGFDMARVFSGSVFQLLFQLVLVLESTPWSSVRAS